jgi:hypothetical protein
VLTSENEAKIKLARKLRLVGAFEPHGTHQFALRTCHAVCAGPTGVREGLDLALLLSVTMETPD